MKDIIIIANFCGDFSKSDNGRFIYLCKELSKEHMVEIITSDFSHFTKEYKTQPVTEWPFKITYLHESGYNKNISFKRLNSHKSWGNSVLNYLKERKKPDVIYCATPSLSAPLKASRFCKENDIKFIIDIQDLWPEAFKLAFNIPILSDIVYAPLFKMEDEIFKNSDEICGVSATYVDRAVKVSGSIKSGKVVFLGTNLDTFDKFASQKPIIDKRENEYWLGYCGSLSASYDLKCAIKALKLLKDKGKIYPKFIVMGDGPKRNEFERLATEYKIEAIFTGRLPYDKMCSLLCECDFVINPIERGAAQSIINKHGDYAASGLPVINTQENEEYRKLVEDYGMGYNCNNGDFEDVSEKLNYLIENEKVRIKMGAGSRKCAEEKFDRKKTYGALINCILS